jgi:hypothetical protein
MSRGSACWRTAGRVLGRRRLGGAAIAGVSPRRRWTGDAVDGSAHPKRPTQVRHIIQ